MSWLAPVERKDHPVEGFDYYYMFLKHQDVYGPAFGLEIIAIYPLSGGVLSKSALNQKLASPETRRSPDPVEALSNLSKEDVE